VPWGPNKIDANPPTLPPKQVLQGTHTQQPRKYLPTNNLENPTKFAKVALFGDKSSRAINTAAAGTA